MTATAYQVAPGNNNAAGLANINPQPATPALLEIEVEWYGNGLAENYGFESATLVWTAVSYSEKVAILTQFGLSYSVPSAYVTVTLRRDGNTWVNFNASASYLRGDKRSQIYGVTGLQIVLNQLEAI